MRHNKMAGTGFLLCSRKKRASKDATKLNTFTNKHLLHSKSTYFYNKFSSMRLGGSDLSTSLTYLAPFCCGVALLVGLGIVFNPLYSGSDGKVYAADTDKCKTTMDDKTGICDMQLGISMYQSDGSPIPADGVYNEQPATSLSMTEPSFRPYSFSVRAVDTKDGYKLYVSAVKTTLPNDADVTNKLVNVDAPDLTINPIEVAEGISGTPQDDTTRAAWAGKWGYALEKGTPTSQDGSDLTYKAVPAGSMETITPIDSSTEDTGMTVNGAGEYEAFQDMNYRLWFGAQADAGMYAGHYRTQVMLSVVADPKVIPLGISVKSKMSEITTEVCKATPTPAAFKADGVTINTDVPTVQLIDDREGDNGTKYWVSKLADGNCWMTQNLGYDSTGNQSTAKKNSILAPNDINNPTSYTEVTIGTRTLSNDPNMATAYTDTTYNGHYRMGNYYNFSQAITACSNKGSLAGAWNWILPAASGTTDNGSFNEFTTTYNIGNSSTGSLTIRKAPFYYIYAGANANSSEFGSYGFYWSSSSASSYYYRLYLTSGSANPLNNRPPDLDPEVLYLPAMPAGWPCLVFIILQIG